MNIVDIAVPEYVEVDVSERLAKVRSIFERENPKGIIVTEDGEYAGVVGEKQLMRSRMEDDTKVSAVMKSAPSVDRHEDLRETARLLVEGDVKIAPVYEGEKLYGIVTVDQILEAVLDSLDAITITVGQIATEDVIGINEKDTVGSAINRLRENGISRPPPSTRTATSSASSPPTTSSSSSFAIRSDRAAATALATSTGCSISPFTTSCRAPSSPRPPTRPRRPSSNACSTTTSPGWWSRRRELTPSRAW